MKQKMMRECGEYKVNASGGDGNVLPRVYRVYRVAASIRPMLPDGQHILFHIIRCL